MSKSAAKIFKEARLKKGLTQIEVAKKSGIYPNTYAKIERGEQDPSFATAKKLAKTLDIDISDIPA
jgi:transcriptional regulator with XRE-family HTH domain